MIRVVVCDNTVDGVHPLRVRASIVYGYGEGLTEDNIGIVVGLQAAINYAYANGASMLVCSLGAFVGMLPLAIASYPELQCVMPLGANMYVDWLGGIYTSHQVIIGTGASADMVHNATAYGDVLDFFDEDPYHETASSYANGVIAGKLLKIKDNRGCGWWETRYRARSTASYADSWTKENGYGVIDVQAAIDYPGLIPDDPYLPEETTHTHTIIMSSDTDTTTLEKMMPNYVYGRVVSGEPYSIVQTASASTITSYRVAFEHSDGTKEYFYFTVRS